MGGGSTDGLDPQLWGISYDGDPLHPLGKIFESRRSSSSEVDRLPKRRNDAVARQAHGDDDAVDLTPAGWSDVYGVFVRC